MRTIPAREIKRRGITAVDEDLEYGPVYIIKNDQPRYVIMSPDFYKELIDGYEEAQDARIRESLEDIKAGRVRIATAEEIMREAGWQE